MEIPRRKLLRCGIPGGSRHLSRLLQPWNWPRQSSPRTGVPEAAKDTAVRQLAQRSGSSAAVKIARDIVAQAPERDVVVSSLDRPAARELWAGRSQGVPVVEDESQEVWNPFTWGRSTESIVRTRLEIQLRETVVRGAYWPTWDSMTRMVIEVEPTKFAQVAADIIEEAGFDSGCLARWVHWALREDETGRADHSGLESRT